MIEPAVYNLYTDDGDRNITIKPVTQKAPGGILKANGVFYLSEGKVELGDIVFDDKMKEWEYNGMGDLTHLQAEELAGFIKNYTTPE